MRITITKCDRCTAEFDMPVLTDVRLHVGTSMFAVDLCHYCMLDLCSFLKIYGEDTPLRLAVHEAWQAASKRELERAAEKPPPKR